MKKILAAIALAATFISGVGYTAYAAGVTFKVVQTPVYHLYTGESSSATSIRITPYPTDLDSVKLTMTDFGSKPTITVDPNLKGVEEIESFTGIVDNGDNTATLTGLSRDLQSKYPYTGTGIGRSHGSGGTVVFGNNPQIYGRLSALENDQTFTGTNTFGSTTQPVYDGNPSFSNPLSLIDKAYADALTITGAPTSTFNGMGVVWLASNAQVSAGTASSTTGAPLVIPAKVASSTYNGSTVFQGEIPALRSTKDIDPNFIATSSGNNYNWGGLHTFTNLVTFTATTTEATTTVASTTIQTANVKNLNVIGTSTGITLNASTTIFTTSGTWTRPAGVSQVEIQMVGGGGGGGLCNSGGTCVGVGGGGGCYAQAIVPVTGNVTVTVGTGGSGGVHGVGGGTSGGNSVFAGTNTVTAGGGTAGDSGGAGGTCTGADLSLSGSRGGNSQSIIYDEGFGGASFWGFATIYDNNSGDAGGIAGNLYGGGGGGAHGVSSGANGAAGAAGLVIVKWYR